MDLSAMCQELTGSLVPSLAPDHPLGERLVNPEYSRSAREVKTYPLLDEERVFALLWNRCTEGKTRVLH